MGVPAEDGVDTGDPGGHLDVHIHAVVGEYDDGVGSLRRADLVHERLHVFFTDAERPIGNEALRVRDRGVGKRLADDRNAPAADVSYRIGRKGVSGVFVE